MLVAAGENAKLEGVRERVSRKGTYLALGVRIHIESAEAVLDVYAMLKELDGVKATL